VRLPRYRPQHGKTLGRDLQTVPAKERIAVERSLPGHVRTLTPMLD
jgi:hypothetical protein